MYNWAMCAWMVLLFVYTGFWFDLIAALLIGWMEAVPVPYWLPVGWVHYLTGAR